MTVTGATRDATALERCDRTADVASPVDASLRARVAAFPTLVRASAWALSLSASLVIAVGADRGVAVVALALSIYVALSVATRARLALLAGLCVALVGAAGGGRLAVISALALAPLLLFAWRLAPERARLATNWMDHALLAQTYPGRPMTTHHVLEVDAPFDRARLARAVASLLDETPSLRSFTRESPLGLARFAAPERWSRLDEIISWRDLSLDLDRSDWYLRPFDLSIEEPLRVLHAPRPGGGYQLVFTLHHSVTDGVGALALFDALLVRYRALDGEDVVVPPALGPSGATLRGLLARLGLGVTAALVRRNVEGARRFGAKRASLMERVDAPLDAVHARVIDVSAVAWARLRDRAAALGCSRNDLLLAAFLRAASAWRRARGLGDEPFRALIPVDLRGEFGVGRTLQNHLAVIEADFTAAEVDDASLPHRVSERLRAERPLDRSLATPLALGVLGAIAPPGALRAFFRWLDERPSAFMYSFLFSHIRVTGGVVAPSRTGASRLYCLSGLPRQPGVGVTVTATPGAVTVTLAYMVPRLSDDGAERLLEAFSKALGEL